MGKAYFFIFILLVVKVVDAQNFIPNGSFEQFRICPSIRNDGRFSDKWSTPTQGTADYFNTCAPFNFNRTSSVDVPDNLGGSQLPRTGNAYGGFYACQNFASPFLEYREYLQVALDSIMIAGARYQFEMYLSLADFSNLASNRIGVHFSTNQVNSNSNENLNVVPQIITTTFITNKTGWTRVSGSYIASGGERFITIGVFNRQNTHTTISVTGGSNDFNYNGVAYYYIDDVSMTRECPLPQNVFGNDISTLCSDQINPITLSASTPNASRYVWNTSDTTTTIRVNQSGTYSVRVSNPFCSVSDTIKVNFNLNPKVDLGKDTTFCGTVNLQLDAQNTGSSFLWNTLSTQQKVAITTPGLYFVRVNQGQCFTFDTIEVKADTLPIVDLGRDTAFCGAFSLPLDSKNTGNGILWNTLNTQPQITVTTPGTYFVRVNKGICVVFDTINVTNDLLNPINLGNDTILCQNQQLELNAFAGFATTYQWNTGNLQPKQIVSEKGKYLVTVRKGVCLISDSIQVHFQPRPNLNLGFDTSLCFNQPYKIEANTVAEDYTWSTGQKDSFITVTSAGKYWLKITDGVCTVADTIALSQKKVPNINLGPDKKICKETPFVIDITNAGNTILLNNSTVSSINELRAPGVYAFQVFNEEGCFARDTITLDTFATPIVNLGKDTSLCFDKELVADPGSFSRYKWQDESTDRRLRINKNGNYRVTVWDENSCSASDEISVNYFTKPNLQLTNLLKICEPDTLVSATEGFKSYLWSDGSSTKDIRILDYGKFTLVVTDFNSCELSAELEVQNNCSGTVYVPNAFTPENGDAVNDFFYPKTINVSQVKFWIYNKWGDLVFYSDRLNEGWNGIFNGEPAMQDVYVYKIEYISANKQEGSLNGNVTLLR